MVYSKWSLLRESVDHLTLLSNHTLPSGFQIHWREVVPGLLLVLSVSVIHLATLACLTLSFVANSHCVSFVSWWLRLDPPSLASV